MFNKEKNKIVIMQFDNVMHYPPTISLVECLLHNGYAVHLVAEGISKLPNIVTQNSRFSAYEVKRKNGKGIISRVTRRFDIGAQFKNQLKEMVQEDDILWTINTNVLRTLGSALEPYHSRHVMQMFELMKSDTVPLFEGAKFAKYNLKKCAQKAWKNVSAERNRAYIQKVEWDLKDVPVVWPNKPYYFECGEAEADMHDAIQQMEQEKRKIIIYLGIMGKDRDFTPFAEAIERVKDEYCLYMFGKYPTEYREEFESFLKKYDCVKYLGFFNPPHHLYFLKYAHIALLPYVPGKATNNTSGLNALYCAPNKIFEYSGSHLPMIGTDVLGLIEPFEKYGIGVCCEELNPDTILNAIKRVDMNHDKMVQNCDAFFESVDLDSIVKKILAE